MKSKIKLNLLVLELTDACNQQCKFCYNHWKGTDDNSLRVASEYGKSKKVLKKIFSQAEVSSVSFSGGEPLLASRVHDLALMCRFHKSQVSILTNGTLMTDTDLDIFSQIGVKRIQIPILSSEPHIHDSLTQLPGSWTKCIEAARKILAASPEKFNAVLVLTKQNIDDIDDTLSFYEQLGVRTVLVNRFNVGGLGRKFKSELELSHKELQESFSKINKFAASHSIQFHSGVCTPVCVLSPVDYPNITFSFCNTDISVRPITINHQGDIRFCNHSPRVLGNIFERPLKEILIEDFQSDYFNAILEYCSDCNLLSTCKGGCRAASEQVYDTFSKVDPVIELK